ncbi:MAG: hypothetical protein HQL71_08135 [Magnetococcales bacterium]|nr:hypothetical protein [Magnetococcales bacterium]
MRYQKLLIKPLAIFIMLTCLPVGANAAQGVIKIPPSPILHIQMLLKRRLVAKDQIKNVRLNARSQISSAQTALELSRLRAQNDNNNLQKAWRNEAKGLSDLNDTTKNYYNNKKSAQQAQRTMREVYEQSEAKIAYLTQEIKNIENEIEVTRVNWANQYGAQLLDAAIYTNKAVKEVNDRYRPLIAMVQKRINREKTALMIEKNNLQGIKAKALKETQQTMAWVTKTKNMVNKAHSAAGSSWHVDTGSYGDIKAELENADSSKKQLKLAISQAKVIGGLIASEIAIATAKVESQAARLQSAMDELVALQSQNNSEAAVFTQKQQMIRTLSSLVRGPVRYKN